MGMQETGFAQAPESTVTCQRCVLSAEGLTRAGQANSGVQLGGSKGICPCQQSIPGHSTEQLPRALQRAPAPAHAEMLLPRSDNNRPQHDADSPRHPFF